MMDASQPITAADGTPLKKKLAQAMFRSKLRATGLVAVSYTHLRAHET